MHSFSFNPRLPHNQLVGKRSPCSWCGRFAVVFFDFRLRRLPFKFSPSAEHLRAESQAEASLPHHQLLFALAPGFLPGRGTLTTDRYATCLPVIR